MAQKLEDLLGPWEQVVFRSDSSRGHSVALSTVPSLLALPALALFFVFAFSNPVNSPAGISSLVMVLFAGYVVILSISNVFKAWRRKVLVTEHRVLYQHGTWRSKITEIPLAEITDVRIGTLRSKLAYIARIERGKKGAVMIALVPRLDELRDAISAQIPIAAAQQSEKALRWSVGVLAVGASLVGLALGLLPTLGLVFVGGGDDFWEVGTVFWDLVFLYPADSTYSAILVGLAGFIGFVAYMWLTVTCFFFGFLFGFFPVFLLLRLFLTPDQAQKTVCWGYASIPSHSYGKVFRWNARQMARFASWLYGQEIRCE